MSAGFEAYAQDGSLLLNSNMIGWFCARSGVGQTITTPTGAYGHTTPSVANIDVAGYTYALTAIRMHGDDYAAARFTNQWQSGNHVYTSDAPVGSSFSWYVYDYAPSLPATAYGMETYTEAGQRSFSSAYMPFKPIADLKDGAINAPGYELAIAGPSPTGYAGTGIGIQYYRQAGGGAYIRVPEEDNPTHWGYTRDCKLWGGRVSGPDRAEVKPVSFDDVTQLPQLLPPTPFLWDLPGPVLAVDVSGIAVPGNFF